MKTNSSDTKPVCKCGSKNFSTESKTRNHLGRAEFKLVCVECGTAIKVGKTIYALYRYLGDSKGSPEFRNLFDLG